MSEDRWTATIASAPAAAASSYASRKTDGEGREVLTCRDRRSAAATSAVVTSTPSRRSTPSTTTCSGTARRPSRSTTSSGRYAVESVTTATFTSAGYRPRSAGDDVDQLGRADDDLADGPAVQRRHDLGAGQRLLLEVSVTDVRGDLDPVAHLALDLHHAGDGVVHEQRRVGHREVDEGQRASVSQLPPQLLRDVRRDGCRHHHDHLGGA